MCGDERRVSTKRRFPLTSIDAFTRGALRNPLIFLRSQKPINRNEA